MLASISCHGSREASGTRIVRRRDEIAAGVLDAGGRDPAQYLVLGDALARRGRVLDDVAAARMEQPVVAPARAAAEVALLDEERVQASPGEIAKETRARGSAADDEGVNGQGSRHRTRVAA